MNKGNLDDSDNETMENMLAQEKISSDVQLEHATDNSDQQLGSDQPPRDPLVTPEMGSMIQSMSKIRKRPSMFEPPTGNDWDHLTAEGKKAKLKALQRECLRKEEAIIQLIKLRNTMAHQKLPPRVLADAKQMFGVTAAWKKKQETSDRWIQMLMKDYLSYRIKYPHHPSAEFFMPLPMGRPAGQQLTDDQKSAIRYAIATRARRISSASGRIRELNLPFEYSEIWKYASTICKMPSYNTVRRYIHSYREQNQALFKLMTEGEAAVERDLLLKKRNDVSRPNERWQADARDLPWYVLYKGKRHRVCLIIVYDDYSGYIISWMLVLKQDREDTQFLAKPPRARARPLQRKRSRSSTFTAIDVILLYLMAMYRTGVRPVCIYTDNGSQFIAAEKYLPLLTRANEPIIQVSHSRPGKPWGRGKVENGLGQLNRLLKRLPGTYNKRDRKSIRDAMHHKDLYTFDEAKAELAKHFQELNERPRRKAPSRFDVWRSVPSLPAPPIRQMALIEGIGSEQQEVTVTSWSVNFKGCEWEPKSVEGKNPQINRRWMDAVARDEKAWLTGVMLATGWKVEVKLGEEWIELVPKSTQQADADHSTDQARALKEMREQRNAIIEAEQRAILTLTGGVHPVGDASSGNYTLPAIEQPIGERESEPPPTSERPENGETKVSDNQSTNTRTPDPAPAAPPPQPPAGEDDELAGLPSLAAQLEKVRAKLGGN